MDSFDKERYHKLMLEFEDYLRIFLFQYALTVSTKYCEIFFQFVNMNQVDDNGLDEDED